MSTLICDMGGVLFDLRRSLLTLLLNTLHTHTCSTEAVSFSDRWEPRRQGRRKEEWSLVGQVKQKAAELLTITLMGDTARAAFDSLTASVSDGQ